MSRLYDVVNKSILHFFLVAFLIFNIGNANSRNWMEKVSSIGNDSAKVDSVCKWAQEIVDEFPNDAIDMANYAKDLARKINYLNGLAYAHKLLGIIYDNNGKFLESTLEYQQAIKFYRKANNPEGLARCEANMGLIFFHAKKYNDALAYLRESMLYFEKTNATRPIYTLNQSIALCWMYMSNYDSSTYYYDKCLKMLDKNPRSAGQLYGNIGLNYSQQKKYAEAGKYLELSLDYFNAHDPNSPEKYLWMQNLAGVYQRTNRLKEGIRLAERVAAYRRSTGEIYTRQNSYLYKTLGSLYYASRDFEKSTIALLILDTIMDRVYSSENLLQINAIKGQYDDEKQKMLIANLKKEKMLQQALIDSEASRKRYLYIALAMAVIIMMTLSFFILRKIKDNKIIQSQKHILEQRNHEIEEKQKEILDSIYYARRIQHSLLTSEKYIQRSITKLKMNYERL